MDLLTDPPIRLGQDWNLAATELTNLREEDNVYINSFGGGI